MFNNGLNLPAFTNAENRILAGFCQAKKIPEPRVMYILQ